MQHITIIHPCILFNSKTVLVMLQTLSHHDAICTTTQTLQSPTTNSPQIMHHMQTLPLSTPASCLILKQCLLCCKPCHTMTQYAQPPKRCNHQLRIYHKSCTTHSLLLRYTGTFHIVPHCLTPTTGCTPNLLYKQGGLFR